MNERGWGMVLTMSSYGGRVGEGEKGYYSIMETPVDSAKPPRTKPKGKGEDEPQDVCGVPGWWWIAANRQFRPLKVNGCHDDDDESFPRKGYNIMIFNFSLHHFLIMISINGIKI